VAGPPSQDHLAHHADVGEPDEPSRDLFGLLTRQAVRRGSFASEQDLVAAIGRYVQAWNADCHPFAWVKDADQILVKTASRSQPARQA
jgi:hypothetical protein